VKKPALSTAERTRRERRRRKSNPAVQAKNRIAVANWNRRNPAALKARRAVSTALKRGDLKKAPSCQIRGCSKARTEAHHHDYRAPLDVLWGCRPHHRQLHSGIGLPLRAGVDRKLARIPRELAA
jgi:hypothetical protein